MKNAKTEKLECCCISISDGDHQPPPKADSGVYFVTISDVNDQNKLDFKNAMHVPLEYYETLDNKRKAQSGDILYSVVGSFGIPVFISDCIEPFVFQRHIAILRPNRDRIIPKYLYYTMLSPEFYAIADTVAIGAAQRTISLSSLRNIKIALPNKNTQAKIVSFLSAYDELIEKNNRKIAILQEQAQELYKEWFVRFRFPGHENVKVENGLPEGWEKGRIKKLCVFARGKNITANEMQDGLIPVISAGIEPSGYHNSANVCGVSITVSSSGANAGFVSIHYSDIWASDCSFVNNRDKIYYVYELLSSIRPCIFNLQRGAAQPHVYPKDLNHLKLIIPDEKLQLRFNAVAEKIHSTIAILIEENENVTRQRDLLLPRLMSGKLEVH